ncbi:flagellar biosynthetic protein FlhB [Caulobacter ginsengisoli]|uniref:Flagellar biosynthetic protein FlhB n=1 Tax=Caulobacter ginsengisoli TaxID=400775 RepID=A0ABU0IK59_9CAUL|nr:flagellar biosynthesis protein FlhB [Caulobacter ginsengisoli]MDQ0462398.1 flagellar biosynthetic protein FlhB [Caulobacter ginsengisoli]
MAEEPAGDKTEEPSPHKLEEARKKGEVAKSQDVPQLLSLAGAFGAMAIAGGWMCRDIAMRLLPFIQHPEAYDLHGGGGVQVLFQAMMAGAPLLLTVLLTAGVAGALGHIMQSGMQLNPSLLAPKFDKLNPMAGLKRLFGIDGAIQFAKSALKVLVTGAIAWFVLKPHASELEGLVSMSPMAMLPASQVLLKALFFAVLAFLAVTAGTDYVIQRRRFMQKMRMTREELKEEFKQAEGDPHVKAKLKQIRAEKSRRRMMQNVPKATVVVMNPTHYAVALRYEAGETAAPECVAKGIDALALRIRQVAEDAGVPIIEDPPLARALYAAVEVDETIPQQHYEAVAKIIGFILGAAQKRAARATSAANL